MALETEPRRVRVNEVDLAYVERGRGIPILFLHGGFSDFRSWSHQLDVFSTNYRAISYSLRYHYPNVWGDGTDYSIPVHTRDLAGLIERLAASPAHVVGTSYGGRIALHLARDRPELVRTLVLAEPAIGSWLKELPGGPAILAELMRDYFDPGEKAIESGDLDGAVRLFVDGVAGRGTFENVPIEVRRRFADNIRVQALPEPPTPFTRDDARKIHVPVLLLNGSLTSRMFIMGNEELEKCLSNVERVEIPGASHLLNVFNSHEFNEVVLAFLAKH